MIRVNAEIAIVGAGYAGSLLALVLHQLHRKPVLLEQGRHPRFAIGESSTPLANLSFEKLCRTYDLPRLTPLSKYGSWQQTYPELACGLKRGFSFFRHHLRQEFSPQIDHANELLVAASPADAVGDTHWFREQFDHFLAQEAQAAAIPYFDQTQITAITRDRGWLLRGVRAEQEIEVKARFLVDASGPASVVARVLGIDCSPRGLRTNSWAVYSHFAGVEFWENLFAQSGGKPADHPFHCDDAALHHVLDHGWMWVLRFNNGLASAGFVFNEAKQACRNSPPPEAIWKNALECYPSIARQFSGARAVRPLIRTERLQRRAKQVAGADWAMLPHSAYFIDPLLSSGIAHTLLGIERLARIFERHWERPSFYEQWPEYEATLQREIDFVDQLVHGCYRAFDHFALLAVFTMYYFAGAIYSETRRRQGNASPQDEFLFSHHAPFRAAVSQGYQKLLHLSKNQSLATDALTAYRRQVAADIAPYNLAGLCDPSKQNLYPFV